MRVQEGFFFDPPVSLVIEVLSGSAHLHDMIRKIDEVWFVDDRDRTLIVHRRTGHGHEVERVASKYSRCQDLPGLCNNVDCLQAIPSGHPA